MVCCRCYDERRGKLKGINFMLLLMILFFVSESKIRMLKYLKVAILIIPKVKSFKITITIPIN